MTQTSHERTDTVIIGGGPSSLILSYILHGHIPYYKGGHSDQLLDSKLRKLPDLLHINPEIYSHFGTSLRYSQQALPINTLLDTLVRPNADTEIDPPSCIEWRYEAHRKVSHLVLTDASSTGGQWTQMSGTASDEIGTLSYSEMLSLPGYSFTEHYIKVYGASPPDLMRPARSMVASYYAAYPDAVGISSVLRTASPAMRVSRTSTGFLIEPKTIHCKNLVLATGIFTHEISPPPYLQPVRQAHHPDLPLLVIGSGFSAADAIIAASPHQKIVHVFKWDPSNRPSPLKGCHHQAYPEYAGIYRQMKAAVSKASGGTTAVSPFVQRKKNPFFSQRDWASIYEGLPNVQIEDAQHAKDGLWVFFVDSDGTRDERLVGGVEYHVGRRGSLTYLKGALRSEVVPAHRGDTATSRTLRSKVEISCEVAPRVYAIGSLTGDSLVRHAFGCCVDAASHIMSQERDIDCDGIECDTAPLRAVRSNSLPPSKPASRTTTYDNLADWSSARLRAHDDLHVDRSELIDLQYKHGREVTVPGI